MPNGRFRAAPPRAPLFGLPGYVKPFRFERDVAWRDAIPADGPALWWRVGESSGTNADDSTANNRDGTYGSGVTLAQSGALSGDADTAVSLDNTSGAKITSTYNPFSNGTVRTFEGWAWRNASTDTDALFGGSVPTAAAPVLQLNAGGNDVEFRPDGSGGVWNVWTGAWPGDAQWVHWVLVFDEASDLASLYINGALVSTQASTSPYAASTGDFAAGARGTGGGSGFDTFNGKLDEIVVYERGLSPERVAAHFRAAAVSTAAVAVDGPALDLIWDTPAEVNGAQLDLLWDTRSQVDGGQLDLLWDLRSQVNGGQLDLLWDLAAAVTGGALDLVWDMRAAVAGAALDLLWDLRAAVDGPALDLIWDLLAEGVEPPPQTGAPGGPTFQPRWSEVDGPPLTLRWGSVQSPRAGEGALTESARPLIEEPQRKPIVRLPRRPRPRPVERPRVPVDAVPLELRWAVRGAVEARVALKWAATEDAMLVGRLQARVAASTAEVARLTREVARAREEAEAAAQGRIQALAGEVARLRDEAESLELLLLSAD